MPVFQRTFDLVHRSVFAIETRNPSRVGTAFAVSSEGHLATALHVIAGVRDPDIFASTTVGGREYFGVSFVAADSKTDLAILRLRHETEGFSPLRISEMPAIYGQSVLALGYPVTHRNEHFAMRRKYMVNLRLNGCTVASDMSLPVVDGSSDTLIEVFEVDANLHPGMSGGPVLRVDGQVLGIISHGLVRLTPEGVVDEPDYTVAIRAEYLRNLLVKYGLKNA